MDKKYQVRNVLNKEEREELAPFSDFLSHMLFYKDVKKKEEALRFLTPKYENDQHDPMQLLGMEKARDRVLKAIKDDEKVVIFSDYDADGIPGGVVLHDFFKLAGFGNFKNYIPHRHNEGFGLNRDAIESFGKEGTKLLITVDCGVSDVEHIEYANSLGIEVIVTDHHEPGEKLPDAYAIINPKISPDYPEKMLCGAGVAYKLVQAILQKERLGIGEGKEKWLLDMVAISTLSDMVPLRGENRVFATYGLKVLRLSRRPGLKKLLSKLKINQSSLTEDDVGFMISPRINAASRMGIQYEAFKLLTTESIEEAGELVSTLEKTNSERKGATAYLHKEVKKIIEAKYSPYFSNKVIVAGDPAWSPSLLGLVAGSLVSTEMKPVFLWGKEGLGGALKGSCRSIEGISVTTILSGVREGVLNSFGGHHGAGGFSISYETVHELESEIEKSFGRVAIEGKEIINFVDFEITSDEVRMNLLRDIEKLAPFGFGNDKPLFLIKRAKIIKREFFGKEKNHLKLLIENSDGSLLEAISFFATEAFIDKSDRETLDIVGNIEAQNFGRGRIRVRIQDLL